MGIFRKLFGASLNDLAKEELEKKKNLTSSPSSKLTTSKKKKSTTYEFEFHVAGVTYKTGNKSRQAMLKKIKNEKEPFESIESVEFIPYTYNNEAAYYVSINDEIIGNIPKHLITQFQKYEKYPIKSTYVDIIGGPDDYDEPDDSYSYGCVISVIFNLSDTK